MPSENEGHSPVLYKIIPSFLFEVKRKGSGVVPINELAQLKTGETKPFEQRWELAPLMYD